MLVVAFIEVAKGPLNSSCEEKCCSTVDAAANVCCDGDNISLSGSAVFLAHPFFEVNMNPSSQTRNLVKICAAPKRKRSLLSLIAVPPVKHFFTALYVYVSRLTYTILSNEGRGLQGMLCRAVYLADRPSPPCAHEQYRWDFLQATYRSEAAPPPSPR